MPQSRKKKKKKKIPKFPNAREEKRSDGISNLAILPDKLIICRSSTFKLF